MRKHQLTQWTMDIARNYPEQFVSFRGERRSEKEIKVDRNRRMPSAGIKGNNAREYVTR